MSQAFVALGSNLADPVQQVQNAFNALERILHTRVVKRSSLYQTTPVDSDARDLGKAPDFINAVAELETDLNALDLLDALFNIENQAGRLRPYRNAPRVLDCDLLMFEDTAINTEKLTLPHPRMHTRGFVLLPLFEIAPQISLPNHGKISELINPSLSIGIKKLE